MFLKNQNNDFPLFLLWKCYSNLKINVLRKKNIVFAFQTQQKWLFAARSAAKSPKMGGFGGKNPDFRPCQTIFVFCQTIFRKSGLSDYISRYFCQTMLWILLDTLVPIQVNLPARHLNLYFPSCPSHELSIRSIRSVTPPLFSDSQDPRPQKFSRLLWPEWRNGCGTRENNIWIMLLV